MVCAPVRSIIPSLKLGDYLSVQAHKPCSIYHLTCLKVSKVIAASVLHIIRGNRVTLGIISHIYP